MKKASKKISLTFLAIFIASSFSLVTLAQEEYALDRVYTGNQVSNTVSVIDPSTNTHLGEIPLGKPQVNVLTPLYKGQILVHGLRFEPRQKLLAVVSIGSNALTLVSTEDNKILKTIYLGRAPHEPTFTPDGKEVWTTVRGEAYLSVVDVEKLEEIKKIPVADGPGMITFTPDGKFAYVCSSFTPVVDVVDTATYQSVKKIPVVSPFSPNIFTSPDGKLVALSHKDVGKVTIIDTNTQEVTKVISTGAITNHVSFCELDSKLLMPVTVGGENCIKIFDPHDDYKLINTVKVGILPHGLWGSPDGKKLYVGLEYMDTVQPIDLEKMESLTAIKIGQSPQALVYAANAVSVAGSAENLVPLANTDTQIVSVTSDDEAISDAKGQLAIRTIGLTDLVEQLFLKLKPNTEYTLALSKDAKNPQPDYKLNTFLTDASGKFAGQTPGLVKSPTSNEEPYQRIIVLEQATSRIALSSKE